MHKKTPRKLLRSVLFNLFVVPNYLDGLKESFKPTVLLNTK